MAQVMAQVMARIVGPVVAQVMVGGGRRTGDEGARRTDQ